MKKKSSAACLCLCLISPSLGERSISDSQEEEIDRSTAFLSLALGYRSVGSSREEGIHCSNFSLNSLDCMLHIIFHAFSLPLCVCVCVCVSLSLSLSLSDKDKDKVPSSHKRSRRNGLQRSSITSSSRNFDLFGILPQCSIAAGAALQLLASMKDMIFDDDRRRVLRLQSSLPLHASSHRQNTHTFI
jgi:hypothetical protein